LTTSSLRVVVVLGGHAQVLAVPVDSVLALG
jgi:hypothetical protein